MQENLISILNELSKEKQLDRDQLTEMLVETMVAAAQKKLPKYREIDGIFNKKKGVVTLFNIKLVVPFVSDPDNEITPDDAQKIELESKGPEDAEPVPPEEGEEVEVELPEKEFDRIAQLSRQMLLRRIHEAERAKIFEIFHPQKGEILSGSVLRVEPSGRIALVIRNVETYLFKREQIPGERFENGEHVRIYLMDVSNDPRKLAQLMISRTHPGFLMKLFEMEVPEVYEGSIEVINAAREPGKRAKVAVDTDDPDLDPVGACVGVRGSRIQAIVSELRGERIDVVQFSENFTTYVQNALIPARAERLEIVEEADDNGRKQTIVNAWFDAENLSLAIGKNGLNIRLASKLLGCHINAALAEETTNVLSIEESLAREFQKGGNPDEVVEKTTELTT